MINEPSPPPGFFDTGLPYEQCKPIRASSSSVWLVEFTNGRKEIHVWHKDATIINIVEHIKNHNKGKEFTVERQDVGIYVVNYVQNSYSGDGRRVNQNMCVVI
jgi:hypothetical protein